MSLTVQHERTIRSDSAVICVSIYHGVWKPVRFVLTEGRLVCQQASRTIWSIPLSTVFGVKVIETRVILGLRRKCLLIDAGKVKRLVCVKNPEEWKNLILQSGSDTGLQMEPPTEEGLIADKTDLA